MGIDHVLDFGSEEPNGAGNLACLVSTDHVYLSFHYHCLCTSDSLVA